MTVPVRSYTIYHSPNAYLGTVLLRRRLAVSPRAALVRRPIFVPRGNARFARFNAAALLRPRGLSRIRNPSGIVRAR